MRPWIPESLRLDGTADATGDLTFTADGNLLGNLRTTLAAGSASYPLQEGKPEQFDYRVGNLEMALAAEGIKASAELALQNGDRMQANLELPGASLLELDTEAQPLRATASLEMQNWRVVDDMLEPIENLRGELQLDIELGGSLGQPRLQGSGQLNNGGMYVPSLQANLNRIKFSARSDDAERLDYELSAMLAQGIVSLRGHTMLEEQQGWQSEISLQAGGVQFGELLAAHVESEVTVEGELEAEAELVFRAPDRLRGRVDLRLPQGIINYPLLEQEIESWEYRDGYLSLVLDDTGINGTGGLFVDDSNRLEAQLNLAGARLLALDPERQPIQARLGIDFDELDLIEFLVPDIDHTSSSNR